MNPDINHVMLDLETFGTDSNACIVSIGAVAMRDLRIVSSFYGVVKPDSPGNGTINGSTVLWWMQQSDSARNALQAGDDLNSVLGYFATWIQDVKAVGSPDVRVWGNGSDFDNVILGNAYARLGRKAPWSFRFNRCFRTMKELAKAIGIPAPARVGEHHNALDDATYQMNGLITLGGRLPLQ